MLSGKQQRAEKTHAWRRSIIDRVRQERALRKLYGEETHQDIVDQVSEDFANGLAKIMNPDVKPHDFQLHSASGIYVCRVCGKAQTRRALSNDCSPTSNTAQGDE